MNKRLVEQNKYDIAFQDAALNGAGTSRYYPMADYGKALFVVGVGAMAAGNTAILQTLRATDKAGTGADVITNNAVTITANTNVQAATITCDAVVATNEVVINGVTFEGVAAAPTGTQFVQDAGDNAVTATNLAAAINAFFGSDIVATANAAVVTLQADEDAATITATGTAVRFVIATTRALGLIELDESFLTNGFTHAAVRVTTNAALSITGGIVRGSARYSPTQRVAALKADTEV